MDTDPFANLTGEDVDMINRYLFVPEVAAQPQILGGYAGLGFDDGALEVRAEVPVQLTLPEVTALARDARAAGRTLPEHLRELVLRTNTAT